MGLLNSWTERFQTGALARLMHRAGQVGFFDYRFAADRLAWTPGLCTLFGLSPAPTGGLDQWYARMDPGDRARIERELWTACALRRRDEMLDYAISLPDGGRRLLSSRIVLRYGREGRPVRMTGLTVAAQPRAPAAGQGQKELLATLGHQLRTPLGALCAANEVLQVVEPGSPDAREALAVIGRQTARLSQLLHDLTVSGRGVEDNSDARASLRARLELEGHEVAARLRAGLRET